MPATNLIIKNRKFIFEKYWSENFDLDFNKNSKEFEDELAYLVNDSIKMQLRSDVPIGAHLSGGIDSSIVSMIASKYSENNFHTFSGGFTEGDEYDETYFAKIVSEKAKTSHHSIFPTELDFVENINKIIWHMDYPCAGPVYFLNIFCQIMRVKM